MTTDAGQHAGNRLAALERLLAEERDDSAAMARLTRHLRQPRYRPELTRIVTLHEEPAGYALIDHRRLRVGGALIDAGVLADVYVRPSLRGSGLFQELMGEYLGTLHEQGLPLALLAGPAALVAPYGFAPFVLDARLVVAAGSAEALAPVAEVDREDLLALYESSSAALPLAEARTPADWRLGPSEYAEFLALRDAAGRVLGYARRNKHDHIVIVEAGVADAGAARALLAGLTHHARIAGVSLMLALSPAHPLTQAALLCGGALTLTAAPPEPATPAPLAGVVDLPGLLTALTPEFDRRLARSRYAGWSGAVRIELVTGRTTLLAEAGSVSVVDGSRPADVRVRQVTLAALAQLLLGYRATADLRATGELDCDDIALGLLDALFPVLGACEDAVAFL